MTLLLAEVHLADIVRLKKPNRTPLPIARPYRNERLTTLRWSFSCKTRIGAWASIPVIAGSPIFSGTQIISARGRASFLCLTSITNLRYGFSTCSFFRHVGDGAVDYYIPLL